MNLLQETIEEELKNAFNVYFDNYDHETESNYVPFGDTFVNSGEYITDESAERCVDDFREDFDFEEFVTEQLLNSPKFEEAVRNVLKTMRL